LNLNTNEIISYNAHFKPVHSTKDQLSKYFGGYVSLIDQHILFESDDLVILDSNLLIKGILKIPAGEYFYGIGQFDLKSKAIFKTSRFRRDFYTVDIDENLQLIDSSRHDFFLKEKPKFREVTDLWVNNGIVIQLFEKKYLIEIINGSNERTLFHRPYRRIIEIEQKRRLVIVKGIGIVSNQAVTESGNEQVKGKYQDDICHILGRYGDYYLFQTSSSDENQLEFDTVNFQKQSYRHFTLNVENHVNSAKVRNGKLIVEVRDKNEAKLMIYNIKLN
ncbi:MAG: hypothetical protein KDD94_03195, partial [Calditrichaeota bacterium]|nr:hypothetical protein [Calditrichota bacterium]